MISRRSLFSVGFVFSGALMAIGREAYANDKMLDSSQDALMLQDEAKRLQRELGLTSHSATRSEGAVDVSAGGELQFQFLQLIAASNGVPDKQTYADRAAEELSKLNVINRLYPAELRGNKPSFASAKMKYLRLFNAMQFRPEFESNIGKVKKTLLSGRAKYDQVEKATNVPWYFVGILHGLEANFNFMGHLHNGDTPLAKQTRDFPPGRPKPWEAPFTWERSAIDALRFKGIPDYRYWDLPHVLYYFEAYNGFGYRNFNIDSPYLWSFSNQYSRGKYTKDGSFSKDAVSQQCGAAVILRSLMSSGDVVL